MGSRLLLTNASVFDGDRRLPGRRTVVVAEGLIRELAESPVAAAAEDRTVDLAGRTLMPGLIDAHFHPASPGLDVARIDAMPASYLALDARAHLEAALSRGFTTVRDAGGGDAGLARATSEGLIRGPRLLVAGKALSQTGGHGDMRAAGAIPMCGCGYHGALSAVVDGADAMRLAVREELRRGADHVKVFVSGGVLSPTDPLWMDQFTDAEIRAAVEEAATRRTYVMAHAHTAAAALRSARLGVRSIEHGTLIDAPTAAELARSGTFVVPTLAVIEALREAPVPLPPGAAEKLAGLADEAHRAVEACAKADVPLGLGTDLFGVLRDRQADELVIRARLQGAGEALRAATRTNARLIGYEGRLGTVAVGAIADLLVLDGDPLEDITLFTRPTASLRLVLREGRPLIDRLAG